MPDTQPTLRIGKWDVGFVGYDWTSLATRGLRHVAYISLPGIPCEQGHYGSVKEAKEVVYNAVRYWFYHLELRGDEDKPVPKRVTRSRPVEPVGRVRRSRVAEEIVRVRRAPRTL